MREYALLIARSMVSFFKSKAFIQAGNLALRHQLCVLSRSAKRPKIQPVERVLWSELARIWGDWKNALVFVKPETVIRWQRRRFKEHWTRLSRSGKRVVTHTRRGAGTYP